MRQRAKLFDDFTNGLDGLTIKQKKDAVANLKRLLSSKVSFIHYLRTTHTHTHHWGKNNS